jgi:hypothetical protein
VTTKPLNSIYLSLPFPSPLSSLTLFSFSLNYLLFKTFLCFPWPPRFSTLSLSTFISLYLFLPLSPLSLSTSLPLPLFPPSITCCLRRSFASRDHQASQLNLSLSLFSLPSLLSLYPPLSPSPSFLPQLPVVQDIPLLSVTSQPFNSSPERKCRSNPAGNERGGSLQESGTFFRGHLGWRHLKNKTLR